MTAIPHALAMKITHELLREERPRCSTCDEPYSPAFRVTGQPTTCSLCGIKRDLAIAATEGRMIEERTPWRSAS